MIEIKTIFVLDDIRNIYMALKEANYIAAEQYRRLNPPTSPEEERRTPVRISLARNIEDGYDIVMANPVFDLWVLDNDLGLGEEGFKFLEEFIKDQPNKLPKFVLSCSANPMRREAIIALFENYCSFEEREKQDASHS